MRFVLFALVVLTQTSFGKLFVAVRYDIPHTALQSVLDKLVECQNREYMQYACAARPFTDQNKDLVILGCGPNLPDKEGRGCKVSFFDKREKRPGEFSFGMSKGIFLTALKTNIAEIQKKLSQAGSGYQHLNLANPFNEQAEWINYVCERKTEHEEWKCYLDSSERD